MQSRGSPLYSRCQWRKRKSNTIRMTSPSSADTVYLSLLYWTVWSSSLSSLLAKSSSASRIISCVVRRSASPSDGCLFFRTVSIICDRDCPFDSVFFFFSLAVVPFVQQIIFPYCGQTFLDHWLSPRF